MMRMALNLGWAFLALVFVLPEPTFALAPDSALDDGEKKVGRTTLYQRVKKLRQQSDDGRTVLFNIAVRSTGEVRIGIAPSTGEEHFAITNPDAKYSLRGAWDEGNILVIPPTHPSLFLEECGLKVFSIKEYLLTLRNTCILAAKNLKDEKFPPNLPFNLKGEDDSFEAMLFAEMYRELERKNTKPTLQGFSTLALLDSTNQLPWELVTAILRSRGFEPIQGGVGDETGNQIEKILQVLENPNSEAMALEDAMAKLGGLKFVDVPVEQFPRLILLLLDILGDPMQEYRMIRYSKTKSGDSTYEILRVQIPGIMEDIIDQIRLLSAQGKLSPASLPFIKRLLSVLNNWKTDDIHFTKVRVQVPEILKYVINDLDDLNLLHLTWSFLPDDPSIDDKIDDAVGVIEKRLAKQPLLSPGEESVPPTKAEKVEVSLPKPDRVGAIKKMIEIEIENGAHITHDEFNSVLSQFHIIQDLDRTRVFIFLMYMEYSIGIGIPPTAHNKILRIFKNDGLLKLWAEFYHLDWSLLRREVEGIEKDGIPEEIEKLKEFFTTYMKSMRSGESLAASL